MADQINYKDCFIKTRVIEDTEGNLKLDAPFQLYHMTIVKNGRNHYCYISKDLKDMEVIAFIHYAIADESKVKSFDGYLGNKWKEVQKNLDVIKHWAIKKEDAFATTNDLGVVTKYTGEDSQDIVHPYMAEEK